MVDPPRGCTVCREEEPDSAEEAAGTDSATAGLCPERIRLQEEVEQLKRALATRDTIATAVGILMAQQSCTQGAAFEMLRRASMRENRKLVDLARAIVSRRDVR